MKAKRRQKKISLDKFSTKVALVLDTPSHRIETELMTTDLAMIKLREFHRLLYHPSEENLHGDEREELEVQEAAAESGGKVLFPRFR